MKVKMRKGNKKTTSGSPRASLAVIDEADAIRISARQQVAAETKGRSKNQDSGPARESGRRGARDSAEESPESAKKSGEDEGSARWGSTEEDKPV